MNEKAMPLPPELRPLATELETFYRELSRLLDEGEAGRFAVVRGAQVVSIWDTYRDELARFFGPIPVPESACCLSSGDRSPLRMAHWSRSGSG
jgi:hypothetical protein